MSCAANGGPVALTAELSGGRGRGRAAASARLRRQQGVPTKLNVVGAFKPRLEADMAAREFHGILHNLCDSNLASHDQDCDSGEWQEPWYPYQKPGAGFIHPGEQGEWRSESDGFATGTSGWVQWVIDVKTFNEPDHTELVQVNWSIPFEGVPNVTCATARFDDSGGFAAQGPPVLQIKPVSYGEVGQAPALAQAATIAPYVFALPWSFAVPDIVTEHLQVNFELHRVTLEQQ
jgi:hypothetical protein